MGNYSYTCCSELYAEDLDKFKSAVITQQMIGKSNEHFWDALEFVENDIQLKVDGWKIHGYYYTDFCQWLIELQECGLRGVLEMQEETGIDFKIVFGEENVTVEIGPDVDWDEMKKVYGEDMFDYDYIYKKEPWVVYKLIGKEPTLQYMGVTDYD